MSKIPIFFLLNEQTKGEKVDVALSPSSSTTFGVRSPPRRRPSASGGAGCRSLQRHGSEVTRTLWRLILRADFEPRTRFLPLFVNIFAIHINIINIPLVLEPNRVHFDSLQKWLYN